MSPELPIANATLQVPSTKNWLLLLSLLTVLLLVGSRTQYPTRGGAAPVLAGRSASGAHSATPLPSGRRVAMKSPVQQHQAPTAFAAAIAL